MKKLTCLLFLLPLFLPAQTTLNPNCSISVTLTGSGQSSSATTCGSSVSNPNTLGLINWTLAYYVDGFSGITIAIQSAADSSGSPGSWGTFAGGTVSTGANPSSATPQGLVQLSGYNPWVRIALTAATGSGKVVAKLYGNYAGAGTAGGGGGSGCVGTQTTPCVVTTNCPSNTTVTVTTSGFTQLIAASGAKVITVCHISVGFASGVNFYLASGTEASTACDTGEAAVTGTYQSVQGIALDVPFSLPAGKALCANLGTSVTGGGLVIYAQQ